jgi:hypothetical protein
VKGVNILLFGGNVGGEVRYDAEKGHVSFRLFSNAVTPPPGVPSDEADRWRSEHLAMASCSAFGHVADKVAALGKGAWLLVRGELFTRRQAGTNLLITEIRVNELLDSRPPKAQEDGAEAVTAEGSAV